MKTKHDSRWTSASELAEMGTCERRILLQSKHGDVKSLAQREAEKRGNAAHAEFYQESFRHAPVTDSSKPWCFIATTLYGPSAPETNLLRMFRDRCLRNFGPGRRLIRIYYAVSPRICAYLVNRPSARLAARALLRPALALARLALRYTSTTR